MQQTIQFFLISIFMTSVSGEINYRLCCRNLQPHKRKIVSAIKYSNYWKLLCFFTHFFSDDNFEIWGLLPFFFAMYIKEQNICSRKYIFLLSNNLSTTTKKLLILVNLIFFQRKSEESFYVLSIYSALFYYHEMK